MRPLATITALTLLTGAAMAETVNFDNDKAGALPAGWKAGVTGAARLSGRRAGRRRAEQRQCAQAIGQRDLSLLRAAASSITDGYVEVKFKPISGREDQAGGLIWRFKDGDNYYVARANALENNVSLYYTEGGSRKTIKYVDAPGPKNTWHTLRVEFAGPQSKSRSMARRTSTSMIPISRGPAQ